jgi:hypothetical protein
MRSCLPPYPGRRRPRPSGTSRAGLVPCRQPRAERPRFRVTIRSTAAPNPGAGGRPPPPRRRRFVGQLSDKPPYSQPPASMAVLLYRRALRDRAVHSQSFTGSGLPARGRAVRAVPGTAERRRPGPPASLVGRERSGTPAEPWVRPAGPVRIGISPLVIPSPSFHSRAASAEHRAATRGRLSVSTPQQRAGSPCSIRPTLGWPPRSASTRRPGRPERLRQVGQLPRPRRAERRWEATARRHRRGPHQPTTALMPKTTGGVLGPDSRAKGHSRTSP